MSSGQGEGTGGLGAVREEFDSLRGELNQQLGTLREDMHEEGGAIRAELRARIDALERVLIQLGGALVFTFVALVVAVLLRTG